MPAREKLNTFWFWVAVVAGIATLGVTGSMFLALVVILGSLGAMVSNRNIRLAGPAPGGRRRRRP